MAQSAEVYVLAITKEKTIGMLKGLKAVKSPGLDGLHPRFLKEIAEEIVEAFVVIFQGSLDSGKIPEDWKMANKAFDKVPHRTLLKNMRADGVRDEDVLPLGGNQRRSTRMILEMKSLSYEEQLRTLDLNFNEFR
eukprot:g42438.t1